MIRCLAWYGIVFHWRSFCPFLAADNMSELEPEDGVVTGAAERMLPGEGGWKILVASMPRDNHILYPGVFLRSKLKLPRTMGYLFHGMLESQKGCGSKLD